MKALCGPKFLRGIKEPCDGLCCGLGKDGKPDPELTERVNRRADGWRRVVGAQVAHTNADGKNLPESNDAIKQFAASTDMSFWGLLAAGQITMRKVDAWQTLDQNLAEKPIYLAS
jgi:hypothetical protein